MPWCLMLSEQWLVGGRRRGSRPGRRLRQSQGGDLRPLHQTHAQVVWILGRGRLLRCGRLVSALKVADDIAYLLVASSWLTILLSSYCLRVPPSNRLEISGIDGVPADGTPFPLTIRRSSQGISRVDAGSYGSARDGCRASRSGSVCRREILQNTGVAIDVATFRHTRSSGRAEADGACSALVSL